MKNIVRLLILGLITCTLTAQAEEERIIDLKQLRPDSVSIRSNSVSLAFKSGLPALLNFYTNGTFQVKYQKPFFRVKLDVRDGDMPIGFARAIAPPVVLNNRVSLVFESELKAQEASQALQIRPPKRETK